MIAATMVAEDGSEVAYECCGGGGKKARFSRLRRGAAASRRSQSRRGPELADLDPAHNLTVPRLRYPAAARRSPASSFSAATEATSRPTLRPLLAHVVEAA